MNWFLIALGFGMFVVTVIQININKKGLDNYSNDVASGIAIGVSGVIMILGAIL